MFCALWLCRHAPVVCHSQSAAVSSLVPPQYHTTPLSPDLDLNTAISFSTTTTWQAYAGENTMSYFSQMVGLCAQNFLAGAAGLAVGVANNFAAQMTTHEHAERQEIDNTVTLT